MPPESHRILENIRTPYNHVEVRDTDGVISFEIAGVIHAQWHPTRQVTRQAWDALAASILLHPDGNTPRILMLGLGGGTGIRIIKTLRPNSRVTAVEIDPGMIALARRYMYLDHLKTEIICADAYSFLRKTRRRFDVIIDDIYIGQSDDATRPSAMNDAMIHLLTRPLNPHGLLAINLITGSGHRRVQSAARASMLRTFPHVLSIRPRDSLNETIVGADSFPPIQAIRAASSLFPNPQDRKDWQTLSCRRLYPHLGGDRSFKPGQT